MKRFLITLSLLGLYIWTGSIYAQSKKQTTQGIFYSYGAPKHSDEKEYNAKGQLPPSWIKNKVTPEQYDTLAMLNILADVDYTMFKGYDTDATNIRTKVQIAGRALNRFMTGTRGSMARVFEYEAEATKNIMPIQQNKSKQTTSVKYVLYSSNDGYDAHVVLIATLHHDSKKKSYVATDYELIGYSLGGAKVRTKLELRHVGTDSPVTQIIMNYDGTSPTYILTGHIDYTDPLGCKHHEYVNGMYTLSLSI